MKDSQMSITPHSMVEISVMYVQFCGVLVYLCLTHSFLQGAIHLEWRCQLHTFRYARELFNVERRSLTF